MLKKVKPATDFCERVVSQTAQTRHTFLSCSSLLLFNTRLYRQPARVSICHFITRGVREVKGMFVFSNAELCLKQVCAETQEMWKTDTLTLQTVKLFVCNLRKR